MQRSRPLGPPEREGAQHQNVTPAFRLISELELLKGEKNGSGGLQPFELVGSAVQLGVVPAGSIARIQSWKLLPESRIRVRSRPTDRSSIVSNSCSPKTPGALERRSFEDYCRLPIRRPAAQ